MATLEDNVRKIVEDFVSTGVLFTALDVSNEVKKVMPFARHREIRDIVRGLYSDMQSSGYSRTPIQVTLTDGTLQDALLYHSLSDSWDLDTKYDTQRRTQNAAAPVVVAPAVVSAPVATVTPAAVVTPVPVTITVAATVTPTDPKQLWDNLFGTAKLFPTI